MKPKIISTRKKTTVYKTVKLDLGKYIVTEQYQNDVLKGQEWKTKEGFEKTHPVAYEPKNMYFQYYEDISFLESDDCLDSSMYYKNFPKSKLIEDWDNFKGFNHVLFIGIAWDGNIYRIDKPDPIPFWRHKHYISGICSAEYDLKKAIKVLEKKKWIRNIEIIDVPYYNADSCGSRAIEFDYKLSSNKELRRKLKAIPMFKDGYFG